MSKQSILVGLVFLLLGFSIGTIASSGAAFANGGALSSESPNYTITANEDGSVMYRWLHDQVIVCDSNKKTYVQISLKKEAK